jgi:hypothetical protein
MGRIVWFRLVFAVFYCVYDLLQASGVGLFFQIRLALGRREAREESGESLFFWSRHLVLIGSGKREVPLSALLSCRLRLNC